MDHGAQDCNGASSLIQRCSYNGTFDVRTVLIAFTGSLPYRAAGAWTVTWSSRVPFVRYSTGAAVNLCFSSG